MKFVNICVPEMHFNYRPKRCECTDTTEAAIMVAHMTRIPCPRVLEIGTQFGDTTANFAKAVLPLGGLVVTVDVNRIPATLPPHQHIDFHDPKEVGSRIPAELKKCIVQGIINPDEQGSLERFLTETVPNVKQYDAVFVDGDHSYEGVLHDYSVVKDMLSPMGVVFFHDVWWDAVPPPVDGPIKLLNELSGCVLNLTHLGVTAEHLDLLSW